MKRGFSALCLVVFLAAFAAFLFWALGDVPAAAQYPKPSRRPVSTPEIAKYLASARFARVVVVDSGGGGDFKKISEALAFVAKKRSSERNWTTRWTVLVYPGKSGSADPDAYGYNYSETSLTVPAYTEVMGFATGQNNPVSWMGGAPVIELKATAGTLVKLGGGSSLTNLQFFWAQAPTAAVKALDHTMVADGDPKNHDVDYAGELTNVSFQLLARSNAFPVDGIVESAGGLSVYGGGVMLYGSSAGRAVVNAGNVAGLGISLHGGRYGAEGCAALMANTATGSLKLYAGVRLDPDGCANDLVRSGSGPIEAHGTAYGTASGAIAHGAVHLPVGTANPLACSSGAAFLNNAAGAEKICFCSAANAWRCALLAVS